MAGKKKPICYQIKAPISVNETVGGVNFVDGIALTNDEAMVSWFSVNGYEVNEVEEVQQTEIQ